LADVAAEAGIAPGSIRGIMFDIGVSSFQLDDPARGFSYMADGPLDMRMDPGMKRTAADLVNTLPAEELTRIISEYGEERWAARIAGFIRQHRDRTPYRTTLELVETIKAAIPAAARRSGPHPAKRTFQALRIAVNDELGALDRGLTAAIDLLAPGGRVVVISFHSLEDRQVKETFAREAKGCICPPDLPVCRCGREARVRLVTRKPWIPSEKEIEANPRSRSAKLRAAERL
jgi:16S rRNA (cytosine1402-N4)-methyltransferase